MEKQFAGQAGAQAAKIGGLKVAAEIMNYMDNNVEGVLMDQIRDQDEDMATQIQMIRCLSLKTLSKLMTKAFKRLLAWCSTRYSSGKHLRVPMKVYVRRFFKNMSKRAADMMRDDIEGDAASRKSLKWKRLRKRSGYCEENGMWRDYAIRRCRRVPLIRNSKLHSVGALSNLEIPII